jgi:hypothetical protein
MDLPNCLSISRVAPLPKFRIVVDLMLSHFLPRLPKNEDKFDKKSNEKLVNRIRDTKAKGEDGHQKRRMCEDRQMTEDNRFEKREMLLLNEKSSDRKARRFLVVCI